MVVKWSTKALKHLAAIQRLYIEKSEKAANNICDTIFEAGDKLGDFPQMAQKEALLRKRKVEYRSLVVMKHFKIVYSVSGNYIQIVDIWDCRQNPKTNTGNIK